MGCWGQARGQNLVKRECCGACLEFGPGERVGSCHGMVGHQCIICTDLRLSRPQPTAASSAPLYILLTCAGTFGALLKFVAQKDVTGRSSYRFAPYLQAGISPRSPANVPFLGSCCRWCGSYQKVRCKTTCLKILAHIVLEDVSPG